MKRIQTQGKEKRMKVKVGEDIFNEESICQVAQSQARQNKREGDADIREMELK